MDCLELSHVWGDVTTRGILVTSIDLLKGGCQTRVVLVTASEDDIQVECRDRGAFKDGCNTADNNELNVVID